MLWVVEIRCNGNFSTAPSKNRGDARLFYVDRKKEFVMGWNVVFGIPFPQMTSDRPETAPLLIYTIDT